uniref:ATP-dependent Clp protease adapter protein CLPS2, chloroplastic-like n=1 Tax=Erigeron canadensis TaxID=72917 RepID=UPI001CB9CA3D|nr:ATP-dependent Clp protease adapter protein CLPS2, chloroplastic-like [Erigeron canadensis]
MAAPLMSLPLTTPTISHHPQPQPPTLSFTTIKPPSSSLSSSSSSSSSLSNSSSSNYSSDGFFKARFGSSSVLRGGGAAGVLERPALDQSQFDPATQLQEGGDIGRVRDKKNTGSGDSYKVLLIDDARHTEKLVVKVLPQAVPAVTPDDASKLFHASRENGLAVVLVTVKEHAEFYAQMMMRKGLRSTIEPDSTTV